MATAPVTARGTVVLAFRNVPDTGHEYSVTDTGAVLRAQDGEQPSFYYEVEDVPMLVGMVRATAWQRITYDGWTGPVPTDVRKEEEVTAAPDTKKPPQQEDKKAATDEAQKIAKKVLGEAKKAPKKEKKAAAPKPAKDTMAARTLGNGLRIGARAERLLNDTKAVPASKRSGVLKRATDLANARVVAEKHDTIIRIWDVYEAAEIEMPDPIKMDKAHFLAEGRMKIHTAGKAAAASTQQSGKQQRSPDVGAAEQAVDETLAERAKEAAEEVKTN